MVDIRCRSQPQLRTIFPCGKHYTKVILTRTKHLLFFFAGHFCDTTTEKGNFVTFAPTNEKC